MPLPTPRSDEKAEAASAAGVETGGSATGALPSQPATPLPGPLPLPLGRFNSTPPDESTALLMRCCRSRRWAARITACRPYPDLDALLAALDEASYDLAPRELTEALRAETPLLPAPPPPPLPAEPAGRRAGTPSAAAARTAVRAAHTALQAAHAAYEGRFGYPFLVCLDGYNPAEQLDQALAAVRHRLGNEPEEERVVAAEELRRLARGRLQGLVTAAG